MANNLKSKLKAAFDAKKDSGFASASYPDQNTYQRGKHGEIERVFDWNKRTMNTPAKSPKEGRKFNGYSMNRNGQTMANYTDRNGRKYSVKRKGK